jgi:cell division transport system permease protein
MNINFINNSITSQLKIVVRLKKDVSIEQTYKIMREIRKIPHIQDIKYISSESALKQLQKKLNKQIDLTNLKTNPLNSYLEVKLDDYNFVKDSANKIKKINLIESVKYGDNIIPRILKIKKIIQISGFVIILLLIFSTTMIASNTIRLTIYARRDEIKIMQLVGAAEWFIRWPFIIEGITHAFIGSAGAILFIYSVYPVLFKKLSISAPFIPILAVNALNFKIFTSVINIVLSLPFLIVTISIAVGILGSILSLNRFITEE